MFMDISREDVQKLFVKMGGRRIGDFTGMPVYPKTTTADTPYLTGPGVAMIARTQTNIQSARPFLEGFGMEFENYLDDESISDAAQLSKFAGQLCYMSFGEKRTKNAQAAAYFDNIKSSGHGSVLEHPNFSMLLWGLGRSDTHEWVRHRAGWGFSQVSQRYVDGKCLRFVERQEYQKDPELHERFLVRIDGIRKDYEHIAQYLMERQAAGDALLSGEKKTDLRKKVNQCARSILPNETEAPIVVTGNIRAWRHVFEMRANKAAEIGIRLLAFKCFLCIASAEPTLFNDYEVVELDDGTHAVDTKYRKV